MGDPVTYAALITNGVTQDTVQVRLTPTRMIHDREDVPHQYSLNDGSRLGRHFRSHMYRWHVDFYHSETAPELLKAHEEHRLTVKAFDEHYQKREKKNADERSRERLASKDLAMAERVVVEAAEAWLDGVRRLPDLDNEGRLLSEMTTTIMTLRACRERGHSAPDCEHDRCQAFLACQETREADLG